MVFSWLNLVRLLFFIALGLLGAWQLRRLRPARGPLIQSRERWAAVALIAMALGLRALLMPTLPPGTYELENVPYDRSLDELTDQIGFEPAQRKIYHNYHTPLLPTFLDGWYVLGNAVGMGGDITWLRLPNLLAAAAFLLLLIRIGRGLGVPAAGWGAAGVFALCPALVQISVYQGHYFLEMVAVAWFCERLVALGVEGRPVYRSLAAAAIVALWTGYMMALVVMPGMLLVLALSWRRGERREGLAASLVVAAFFAPIAAAALETAVDFLSISVIENMDHAAAEGLFAVHGHHPMQVDSPGLQGFLGFPLETGAMIFGGVGATVALVGFVLALILRPGAAWVPALLLILQAAASTRMAARWVNYTSTLPFLLFVPLWGAAMIGVRLRRGWLQVVLVALMSVGLIVAGVLTPPPPDRLRAPADMASWILAGERLDQLSAPLQEETRRDLPVMVLTVEKDAYYHTCADRETTPGYLACKDEYYRLPRRDGFRRGISGGRALAFSDMERVGPTSGAPCPRVDHFREDPAWSDTPFLVLVTPEFRRYEAEGLCTETFPRNPCELLTEAVGIQVYLCPPFSFLRSLSPSEISESPPKPSI